MQVQKNVVSVELFVFFLFAIEITKTCKYTYTSLKGSAVQLTLFT